MNGFKYIPHFFLLLCACVSITLHAASMDYEDDTFSDHPITGSMVPETFESPEVKLDEGKPDLINQTTPKDKHSSSSTEKSNKIAQQPVPVTPVSVQQSTSRAKEPGNNKGIKQSLKSGLEQLQNTELLDEEALTTSISKVLELKSDLDQLDQAINEKVSSKIEQSAVLSKFSQAGSGDTLTNTSLATLATMEQSTEVYQEPEGFFGWLLKIPAYLFDLKILLILGIAAVVVGALIRAIRFVANRIY